MGKRGKELAQERRRLRRDEIAQLRLLPYPPHRRWWSASTVAVVTGGNRGIGFELARQLAVHGVHVVLTARDPAAAATAACELRAAGLSVDPWQLDICDPASVSKLRHSAAAVHGGVDILVNNAGVNFNAGADNSVEFAEQVIQTNYFGTKRVIDELMPIMNPSPHGARIVNVTSRLGRVNGRRNRIGDAALRDQLLSDETLSEELIDSSVMKFLEDVKQGTWSKGAWPQMYTDYAVSKMAINAYTRFMARRVSGRPNVAQIYMNCYCPGWVKTAMTRWEGNMSVEEGADTGVWLALLPWQEAPNGKFFAERREISF